MARGFRKLFKIVFILLVFTLIAGIGYSFYSSARYPISYETTIKKYSEEYDIDPYLVAAVISVESSFDKNARSPKDARGLMQIMPETAEWAAGKMNLDNFEENMLYDPDVNIRMGTWYLSNLKGQFNNNIELVLAAYNGGSGNVTKWLEDEECSQDGENLDYIPFKETREYVDRVMNKKVEYENIHEFAFLDPQHKENNILLIVNHLKNLVKNIFN